MPETLGAFLKPFSHMHVTISKKPYLMVPEDQARLTSHYMVPQHLTGLLLVSTPAAVHFAFPSLRPRELGLLCSLLCPRARPTVVFTAVFPAHEEQCCPLSSRMECPRALLFHSVPKDPFQPLLLLTQTPDHEQAVKELSKGTS